MWDEVCRAAIADTNASAGEQAVRRRIDTAKIVYCQSFQYDDPVQRLSERLGIDPAARQYSGIGGTVPQQLVNAAAESILRGDSDVALVTGAEALDTKRRLKKLGTRPDWSFKDPDPKPFPFEAPFHPAEVAHEVFQAWLTFAIFEIGRRGHLGTEPAAHRRELGELLGAVLVGCRQEPIRVVSRRAHRRRADHPEPRQSIGRLSIYEVHDFGDGCGHGGRGRGRQSPRPPMSWVSPTDQRVYMRGWCYGTDPVYVAEHREMWRSPAMAAVSHEALLASRRRGRRRRAPRSLQLLCQLSGLRPRRVGARRPTTLVGSRSPAVCRSPAAQAATT